MGVSIPYIQIKKVFKKETPNYGNAINIETSRISGSYMLGFKVEDLFEQILNELQKLHKTFMQTPYLGLPDNLLEMADMGNSYETIEPQFGETQFTDNIYNENQNLRAVYKIDDKNENEIVFNPD